MKCAQFIRNLSQIYEVLKKNPDPFEIKKCLRANTITLKLMNRRLRMPNTNHCEKLKIQTTIGVLKSIETKIKNLLKVGGAVGSRNKRTERVRWTDITSVFAGRIRSGSVVNLLHKDLNSFFIDAKKTFIPRIKNALKIHQAIKVSSTLFCRFELFEADGSLISDVKNFPTKAEAILQSTDLDEWFYINIQDNIHSKIENDSFQGSGWSMCEIINLTFNIHKYSPLKAGTFVDLPNFIKNKKAVLNIQNNDEYCFLWCIMAALFPVKNNGCKTSSYPAFQDHLKYDDLEFPLKLKNVKKFEIMNDLSINVYAFEKKEVYPVYLSSHKSNKETIHLLMLSAEDPNDKIFSDDDENDDELFDFNDDDFSVFHFCLIKNLSRLVSTSLSKRRGKVFICDRCLNHFVIEASFLRHKNDCNQIKKQCKMNFPSEDKNILTFKNYSNKEYLPFMVVGDLECLLIESDDKDLGYQKHEPCSIGYYTHCTFDENLSNFDMYTGKDCIQWFVHRLYSLATYYHNLLNDPKPMILSDEEKRKFNEANICHICEKPFTPDDKKCMDHCHLSGKFRGASHNKCNLNFQDKKFIPCLFHNFSRYDQRFLFKALANCYPGRIKVLPENKETYISFTKEFDGLQVSIRFLDSFKFLPSSLSKLASYLHNDDKKITRSFFPNDEQFELLTRKGVCCYDYLDSWEKLDYTQLPSKEDFYSKLNEEHITDEDYQHAQRVWSIFEMKTLRFYLETYLQNDVLLTADIIINFRKTCMKIYGLDPLRYYTLPSLSMDAMLKKTEVKLELLTCSEMYHFIERGMRGGLAVVSHRYAEANNKYLQSYDASKPTSYLLYLDINNLYGMVMISYLPYGGFEWISPQEFDLTTENDGEFGYILEVDFEYPESLFELHSDFPLAPHHVIPSGSRWSKLMGTFYDKKNYVIHFVNLKQYVELGLKLTKIHRVLKFKQAQWLKPYIELNTELRQQSTNDFEKNFFKLANNSVYGKVMQNPRHYHDVRIVTKFEGRYGAKALISKPNFHSSTIIDDDLLIIEMDKTSVLFDKPFYVGFSILDLSKTVMVDFHFQWTKKKFGNSARLLYTDTDSMVIQVFCDDIYKHIREDIHRFDTSGYPPDNPYNIPQRNRCVLGLMKDELNGKVMKRFIGVRAKSYALEVEGEEKSQKRLKGVKRAAVRNIEFEDFANCLFNRERKYVYQNLIVNKHFNVYTVKQKKLALSYNDDKRIILQDMITTVPYGYTRNPDN